MFPWFYRKKTEAKALPAVIVTVSRLVHGKVISLTKMFEEILDMKQMCIVSVLKSVSSYFK